jgi:hypothetical protein
MSLVRAEASQPSDSRGANLPAQFCGHSIVIIYHSPPFSLSPGEMPILIFFFSLPVVLQ